MKSFSISKAIRHGWSVFEKRPWFFVGSALLSILIIGSISALLETKSDISIISSSLAYVVGFFAQTLIQMAWLSLGLSATKSSFKPTWSSFFAHTTRYWHLVLAALMYNIALLVIIGVGAFALVLGPLGFIVLALAIAGVFALVARYQLYFFAVLESKTVKEAFRASAAITKGRRFKFLLFLYALALLNIAGVLALGVGLFITIPVSWLAYAHVYKELKNSQ